MHFCQLQLLYNVRPPVYTCRHVKRCIFIIDWFYKCNGSLASGSGDTINTFSCFCSLPTVIVESGVGSCLSGTDGVGVGVGSGVGVGFGVGFGSGFGSGSGVGSFGISTRNAAGRRLISIHRCNRYNSCSVCFCGNFSFCIYGCHLFMVNRKVHLLICCILRCHGCCKLYGLAFSLSVSLPMDSA